MTVTIQYSPGMESRVIMDDLSLRFGFVLRATTRVARAAKMSNTHPGLPETLRSGKIIRNDTLFGLISQSTMIVPP